MSLIENIPYKKSFIIQDDLFFQMKVQTISITKSLCDTDIQDHYYLRVNTKDDNNKILNEPNIEVYYDNYVEILIPIT